MCFNCGDLNHPETKEVKDVFCNECKHYQKETMHKSDVVKNRCFHDKIFYHEKYEQGTPIRKGFLYKWTYPGNCFELNKHNDCELFEKIERVDRSEMKS